VRIHNHALVTGSHRQLCEPSAFALAPSLPGQPPSVVRTLSLARSSVVPASHRQLRESLATARSLPGRAPLVNTSPVPGGHYQLYESADSIAAPPPSPRDVYQRASFDSPWVPAFLNGRDLPDPSLVPAATCLGLQPHLDYSTRENFIGVICRQTKHIGGDVLASDVGA